MACIYPYDDSPDALFRPAEGLTAQDYFQRWSRDDIAEPHLLCAEMSRLAYADRPVVENALRQIEFTLIDRLGGERLRDRFAAWGCDGFVAADGDGRTVVAFRGTESDKPEDLLVDLLARPVDWAGGGQVHEGFAAAFAAVQAQVRTAVEGARGGPLLLTGHSLGAGLATLVAAERRHPRTTLITFGSPRVGDRDFGRLFDDAGVARFVNCCDVVARVPPEAFDEPHLQQLLVELTDRPLVARAAAVALSAVLSGIAARFVDVAPARYVNAEGRVTAGMTGDDVKGDQDAARARYRDGHRPAPSPGAIGSGLLDPIGVLPAGDSVRDRIRSLARRLFPGIAGGAVPLRDLADHAPINYVSAMVRSFRAAGATPCEMRRRRPAEPSR